MSEIYSRRPADFIWTIKDIKQKVKNEIFEMVSEEFQLSGYPNKAKAKLELTADGWLNASILIIDDGINREGTFKNLTVLPSFCYVLKSQYESKKYDIVRPVVYTFGSAKLDFTKFNYNQKAFLKLYLINATSLHNRNDAITVEFHVEPPTITRHVYSYNKILNWAIDQYAGKRKRARYSGQVFDCSPYIYSGGYRVQVHMLLNGLGDFHRQGITANVLFLTGENDERLPKSFLHRTTVTLIDQKHPGRNIVKSVEKDIKKTRNYIINLATFKEIDKMILNDILYYQVRVEPVVVVPPVN